MGGCGDSFGDVPGWLRSVVLRSCVGIGACHEHDQQLHWRHSTSPKKTWWQEVTGRLSDVSTVPTNPRCLWTGCTTHRGNPLICLSGVQFMEVSRTFDRKRKRGVWSAHEQRRTSRGAAQDLELFFPACVWPTCVSLTGHDEDPLGKQSKQK